MNKNNRTSRTYTTVQFNCRKTWSSFSCWPVPSTSFNCTWGATCMTRGSSSTYKNSSTSTTKSISLWLSTLKVYWIWIESSLKGSLSSWKTPTTKTSSGNSVTKGIHSLPNIPIDLNDLFTYLHYAFKVKIFLNSWFFKQLSKRLFLIFYHF